MAPLARPPHMQTFQELSPPLSLSFPLIPGVWNQQAISKVETEVELISRTYSSAKHTVWLLRQLCSLHLQHLATTPGPPPPVLGRMDRSTQELFLNFMIVFITVLLMWLLVKSYQD
ncbi:hypothetical protein AALO_G00200620 [Alosa alosa]|uniref:Cardiac phospholamban n=1 Tax=Alosa alosa TaxID=278164 RepID=A0AAV6G5B6_9TELE|nr:hypothetical protein AALO_G00200620 [Alosa alosa]